jgi:hypothetical protein
MDDEFMNEFNNIIESLYRGSLYYYNAWVEDTHNFNNPAPEVNINWKGHELQDKRYKLMKKIGTCYNIKRVDFNFLTKQPEVDLFFKKHGISYDKLPLKKNVVDERIKN